jgi:hypothetical protein
MKIISGNAIAIAGAIAFLVTVGMRAPIYNSVRYEPFSCGTTNGTACDAVREVPEKTGLVDDWSTAITVGLAAGIISGAVVQIGTLVKGTLVKR